jgi:hypothetical protein
MQSPNGESMDILNMFRAGCDPVELVIAEGTAQPFRDLFDFSFNFQARMPQNDVTQ